MTLAPGDRLGAYEVTARIGAGGMGEVYRAHDSRLGRDVALKVLPHALAAEPDRIARFEREAQLLASLDHPNIAIIHGFETAGGVSAIVLELIHGLTLAERIALGPVSLDEALPMARQIVSALSAAHDHGVIHRDLKPANIKVHEDGRVKVLDFGLAKMLAPEPGTSAAAMPSQSPTITSPAVVTGAGMLLGTAAYMSPEQAKGRPADKRSDVWAFGCVLYEMLTGRRAFTGEDVSDTLAGVLKGEPDWSALPSDTPPALRTLLRRCLEKDRVRRVHDAATLAFVLDEVDDRSATEAARDAKPSGRRRIPGVVPAVAGVLLGAAVTLAVLWRPQASEPIAPVVRMVQPLPARPSGGPPGVSNVQFARNYVAISPDGARVAYVVNDELWVRETSAFEARAIPVANLPDGVTTPVFSPDGRSLAFHSAGDRLVMQVPVTGGIGTAVCPVDAVFGMSWETTGIFIGLGERGLGRCPAAGGPLEVVAAMEDGEQAHGPRLLPGGDGLLFAAAGAPVGRQRWARERWDRARIVVVSLSSGQRTTLIDGGSEARYVAPGYLLYAVDGVVFAAPFDAATRRVMGPAVPVIEGVSRTFAGTTGVAQFDVSARGDVVFVPGPTATRSSTRTMAFATRAGDVTPLPLPPGPYVSTRVSPNAAWLAVGRDDGRTAAIWTYRLDGTSAFQRLTTESQSRFPVWHPDSERVAFQSDRDGSQGIFVQRIGGGTADRLTSAADGLAHVPESWSPDGRHLLFSIEDGRSFSLRILTIADGSIAPFGVESLEVINAVFSPDGRFVAYAWSPDGQTASPDRGVYVQPFPPTGERYAAPRMFVSCSPLWTADGRELIYVGSSTTGTLVATRLTAGPTVTFSPPTILPSRVTGNLLPDETRLYDILPDGRFVGVIDESGVSPFQDRTELRIVLNWFRELGSRIAAFSAPGGPMIPVTQ